jgi:nicotinamide-nucleotide amidase
VSQTAEIAAAVAELLDGRSVGCAESCTAGRIAQAFAAVEYASDWLPGGLVAYQIEMKRRHLGVRAESMYSEQCAAEMALGAAKFFGSEVAVSTTGVVGDEPQDGVAPGTIFVGTFVDGDVATKKHHVAELGDAASERGTALALDDLRNHLVSMRQRQLIGRDDRRV